jgi:hypothetical protein
MAASSSSNCASMVITEEKICTSHTSLSIVYRFDSVPSPTRVVFTGNWVIYVFDPTRPEIEEEENEATAGVYVFDPTPPEMEEEETEATDGIDFSCRRRQGRRVRFAPDVHTPGRQAEVQRLKTEVQLLRADVQILRMKFC